MIKEIEECKRELAKTDDYNFRYGYLSLCLTEEIKNEDSKNEDSKNDESEFQIKSEPVSTVSNLKEKFKSYDAKIDSMFKRYSKTKKDILDYEEYCDMIAPIDQDLVTKLSVNTQFDKELSENTLKLHEKLIKMIIESEKPFCTWRKDLKVKMEDMDVKNLFNLFGSYLDDFITNIRVNILQ